MKIFKFLFFFFFFFNIILHFAFRFCKVSIVVNSMKDVRKWIKLHIKTKVQSFNYVGVNWVNLCKSTFFVPIFSFLCFVCSFCAFYLSSALL